MGEYLNDLVMSIWFAVALVVAFKWGHTDGRDDERRKELLRTLQEEDEVLAAAKAKTPPGTVLIGYAVYRYEAPTDLEE